MPTVDPVESADAAGEKDVEKLLQEVEEAKRRCKEKEEELAARLQKSMQGKKEKVAEPVESSEKPGRKWPGMHVCWELDLNYL